MTGVLDEIIAAKRTWIETRRRVRTLADLRAETEAAGSHPDARAILCQADRVTLVAEIKRRAPSSGTLAAACDPAVQVRSYADGGARAVSILTDATYFGGSDDDLSAVRAAVQLPILRKDFIIDAYQVYETAALGATFLLLIAEALPDGRLDEFAALAPEVGLVAWAEAHEPEALERAIACGAPVVGVNNRDLQMLDVDLSTSRHLLPFIPADRVRVSESAIASAADVTQVAAWGADAVLVGSALMREGDPEAKARELSSVAKPTEVRV